MTQSTALKQKLSLLPAKPGVYLMKNSSGNVIYVGKSKLLKNRIRSYFSSKHRDAKTIELVSKIRDLDYIITGNEEEALLLENNLIKKYKPKYNILLMDDKQYPFIKITLKEEFPRVFVTRDLKKDHSEYFGPYTDSKAIRKTLRLLEWIFPHRTCSREITESKQYKRACMNYQMGKCPAPCIGKISRKEYKRTISNIKKFLKGRNQDVIDEMKMEMTDHSAKLEFEKAALVRDKIMNIQKLNHSRNMFFTDEKSRDVIGLYKEDNKAAVSVLKILSGKLLNKEIYALNNVEGSTESELMEAFIKQYYHEKTENLPYRIIVQIVPENQDEINVWLKNKLLIPQRGEMKALVTIAKDNAFNFVEEQKLKYLRKSNRTIFPVKELKDKLGLKKLPRKIVCFDISTIQGTDTVSSLVFFENGKPKKKNYRRFIIKTVIGQDDFASLAETLNRYLGKIEEYDKPDLMVIDGGKGQLSSSFAALQQSGVEDVEMISLAKRLEEVFLPGRKSSIILPRTSSALRLLVNLRDEAHRFAITFHRKRRSSRTLISELSSIEGVGENTKFLLLRHFGSVANMKKSNVTELTKIKGVGQKTAEKILSALS